mgnify:CR=1 FL=1
MRTVRLIFWVVFVCLFLTASMVGNAKNDTLAPYVIGALVIWWFTGAFFSRLIGSMLVSSIRCKGCGLEIPAVGQWQIGSYTDHRERHYILAKNPLNGGRLGHISCPQCSSTILL